MPVVTYRIHTYRILPSSSHYNEVIMGAIASLITSLTIVYSTVYSDTDQRKHQSSASLAFVQGIHRGPVNSMHKWPVTRKTFPFDDVIMVNRYSTDTTLQQVSLHMVRRNTLIYPSLKTVQCHTLYCVEHINSLSPNDAIWQHRSGSTLDNDSDVCKVPIGSEIYARDFRLGSRLFLHFLNHIIFHIMRHLGP